MVTRETKIGLVVACAFLCLLGVVLAGKYTTLLGTPPTRPSDQQVAANDEKAPDKERSEQTPLEKLSPGASPALEPAPAVVQAGGTDLAPLPPLEPDKSAAEPAKEKTESTKTDDKSQLPPLEPKDEAKDDKLLAGDADKKEAGRKEKPAPVPQPMKDDDSGAPLPPLPVAEADKKSDSKPPADVTIELPTPPPLKKTASIPVGEAPTPVADAPTPVADAAGSPVAAADNKKKTAPAMPLPGQELPAKGTPAGAEKATGNGDLSGSKQYALGKPVPLPPVANAPGSPAPAANASGSAGAPARSVGTAKETPASRGPSRPPSAAVARVESFDEETYRPRAEDTFGSISKRYYQSEKYAQALLLFNREHPRAGEGVRRDPPVLAGQPVYVPPIHVLEKRHGEVIEGYTPPPSKPSPVGRELPQTETGGTYQVGPNGETMKEIARIRLGSSDRWSEIAKLNPGWRPDYPIPGGTTLRLPAEARGNR